MRECVSARALAGTGWGFLFAVMTVVLASPAAWAGDPWWKTGKVSGYPSSQYMTALGYGSTLSRAQKDATRNLSSQIDSNIRSRYNQKSARSGMVVNRSVENAISVRTHAKLYGILNIRGRWVASENSYIAVVGVKRDDLVRYLRGRVDNYRKSISELRADLAGTANPMRQIKDLSGIVRSKEKAAFYDRERAIISGGVPSNRFDTTADIRRIESLLSSHMTVTVSLRNGCGTVDRFVRHVAGSIQQEVTDMGLLVVPSGGQVVIAGTVSARPMGDGFSRRYKYYALHYALTMAASDGTIWGSVVQEHKVAGITPDQAEMLAVRKVGQEGVRPLLQGLRSRLFLSSKDQNYVSFPVQGGKGLPAITPSGSDCNDFRK